MKVRAYIADREEVLDVDPETTVGEIMERLGCRVRDGWAGRGSRGELFGITATDPIRFYARDGEAIGLWPGTWVRLPGIGLGWNMGHAVLPGQEQIYPPRAPSPGETRDPEAKT